MIMQSPESPMPEPYKTYVRQRSESIANVLGQVVGDTDVQLCPRAILPEERVFPEDKSLIYGVVVREMRDGFKSVLYGNGFDRHGIATSDINEATGYAEVQLKKGNRVRVKDPRESDGRGQYTVDSVGELLAAYHDITDGSEFGCVLMPHLSRISHRMSYGRIQLGELGEFTYVGREETADNRGSHVYGGTSLGLFHSSASKHEAQAGRRLDVPDYLIELGKQATAAYVKRTIACGRVTVDVIEGFTDSGERVRDVVDITPRVGGATAAETLALREASAHPDAVCYASSRLMYDPKTRLVTGINFVDTDTLIINAQVQEVRE